MFSKSYFWENKEQKRAQITLNQIPIAFSFRSESKKKKKKTEISSRIYAVGRKSDGVVSVDFVPIPLCLAHVVGSERRITRELGRTRAV